MSDSFTALGRRASTLRGVCVLAVVALALAGCGEDAQSQSGEQKESQPTPVHTTQAQPHTVDVYAEYPGRVEGKQTAQIIGRVNGVLEAKNYTEGQIVHKGDLLFTIDPKPYRATVNQRKANLSAAKAALENSRRVWKRTQRLYKVDAVSQAERDQTLAQYQSDKASVQQAQANLESAQIDLGYTNVKAPITGVTSLRDVDLGSLVVANQTQLTTITQLDPVYVLFALPENDAFARRKVLSEMGEQTSNDTTREATIILSTGTTFPNRAVIDFTQSTIDPETGTVQLRAIVKNPDNALMPGRYVRARVRIQTLQDAITVPSKAISDDGARTQVFLVKDGKANSTAVTLGPNTDQGVVITDGLSAGDQVVTTGLGSLKAGAPVKVQPGDGIDENGKKESSGGDSAPGGGEQSASTHSPAGPDDRLAAVSVLDRTLRLYYGRQLTHGSDWLPPSQAPPMAGKKFALTLTEWGASNRAHRFGNG